MFLEYSFSRGNGLEILPTFLLSLDVDDLALHCSSQTLGRKPTRDIYFLFLFPPQPSRGRFATEDIFNKISLRKRLETGSKEVAPGIK